VKVRRMYVVKYRPFH